jgi:hypothetical protein
VLNDRNLSQEPAEAPVSNRTRVRRMIWLFAFAVAVRIVYFMVMAPHTPDWDPKPIQRNGFLTIAFAEMFITTTYSMASEPLFAASLAVHVLFLIRAADRPGLGIALAAGVMLGLTALSRPTVLWLPVPGRVRT